MFNLSNSVKYNKYEDPTKTNPEQRAVQKFRVFLTFPVTTWELILPSQVTTPPKFSITYIKMINAKKIHSNRNL